MFYLLCFLFLTGSYQEGAAAKDSKIIGGQNVSISQYSYQLAMNTSRSFCGASIISPDWALTAAHCFMSSKSNITFRAGSSSATTGGTLHYGTEVYVNENFSNVTGDYDIALVKVSPPFPVGSTVKTVPLASSETKAGTEAVVTGWGVAKMFSTAIAPTLQAAKLRVRSRLRCSFISNVFRKKFTDRMICAGAISKTACNGDSGGPLVNVNTGEQIGIVSYGLSLFRISCIPGLCHFYTNVANQRNWIKQISGV